MPEAVAWAVHPYEGCLQKLARAREHRDQLVSLGRVWLEGQLGEVVVERGGDPATWHYRLPELTPPPIAMGAVVSDVLGQLRSTLDHLAAFLVVSRGRAARVGDAKFPVCWDAEPWPAAVRKYLPGVTGTVVDLLAQVQPFEDRRNGVLDLLVQSSNMDKHRYLLPVVTVATSVEVLGEDLDEHPGVLDLHFRSPRGTGLSPGQVIADVVMASADDHPPPFHLHLTAAVAFGTTGGGQGAGLTTADLRIAADIIEGLVRRLIAFDMTDQVAVRADP